MPTSPDATSLSKPHTFPTPDQPTSSLPIDTSNGVPYTWGSGRAEGIRAAASAGADADPTPLDPTDGTISQELAKGSTRPSLEDLKLVCHGAARLSSRVPEGQRRERRDLRNRARVAGMRPGGERVADTTAGEGRRD